MFIWNKEDVAKMFQPAFCGSKPGWVAGRLMEHEAIALAAVVVGARVQRPEFEAWNNQPCWAVAVDGAARPTI